MTQRGLVRGHWGVEHSLHWCLDVGFREDSSRVRTDHGPENLALLRKLALNLAKSERTSKRGMQAKRRLACLKDDYLIRLLCASRRYRQGCRARHRHASHAQLAQHESVSRDCDSKRAFQKLWCAASYRSLLISNPGAHHNFWKASKPPRHLCAAPRQLRRGSPRGAPGGHATERPVRLRQN